LFRRTHPETGAFNKHQQAAGFFPKYVAGQGKLYASMSVLEQRNLQIGFQFPDCSGKRRWFNMNLGGGTGKALFFGNGQEIA
jgi:hypothetical protein